MDADRFDRLVITFDRRTPRRTVLGLLGALGLTRLVARDVAAQSCAVNGTRCGRATDPECCSGWCKRKRGTNKKFCRQAPGQGICTIDFNACTLVGQNCNADGSVICQCFVTTQGYSFCGKSTIACFDCASDAACEQRSGGHPGDRCVVCTSCPATTNDRACVPACPNRAKP